MSLLKHGCVIPLCTSRYTGAPAAAVAGIPVANDCFALDAPFPVARIRGYQWFGKQNNPIQKAKQKTDQAPKAPASISIHTD